MVAEARQLPYWQTNMA